MKPVYELGLTCFRQMFIIQANWSWVPHIVYCIVDILLLNTVNIVKQLF